MSLLGNALPQPVVYEWGEQEVIKIKGDEKGHRNGILEAGEGAYAFSASLSAQRTIRMIGKGLSGDRRRELKSQQHSLAEPR